jgi:uncharacterized protein (AIM24 family)
MSRDTTRKNDFFEIVGTEGNQHLQLHLRPGQAVFVRNGAMMMMDYGFDIRVHGGGIGKMFARGFSGNDVFMTEFSVPEDSNTKLTLTAGSSIPGSVLMLRVKPGQTIVTHKSSFIASTDNIIDGVYTTLRGGIMSEGFFMATYTVPSNSRTEGVVWLQAFGNLQTLDVLEGSKMQFDNGLILAVDEKIMDDQASIGLMGGGIVKSIFTGEGLVMTVRGPAKVYAHTQNIQDLAKLVLDHLPPGALF